MSRWGTLYNGENTLLIDSLWPVEQDIVEVDCETCEGRGVEFDADDEPVTYNGITIQRAIPCIECMGSGKREVVE